MTEDILKTFTEKEFRILASMEILEDEMWVNGSIMLLDEKEKILYGDTYNRSFDETVKSWKAYFNSAITEPCWADGKHMGDCTRMATTCFRCMCEERVKKVRNLVKNYEKMLDSI